MVRHREDVYEMTAAPNKGDSRPVFGAFWEAREVELIDHRRLRQDWVLLGE